MFKLEWILCPICGSKTREKIREDRSKLAEEMDENFYGNKKEATTAATTPDLGALVEMLKSNPELFRQALQTVQLANKA